MKTSKFRLWVQEIWYENSEEHLTFKENPYTIKEYWERYKYWLKREFKHQQSKSNNEA
jgi:hypothetical protein